MGNLQSMIKIWHEHMVKLTCECIVSIIKTNELSNANALSALSMQTRCQMRMQRQQFSNANARVTVVN